MFEFIVLIEQARFVLAFCIEDGRVGLKLHVLLQAVIEHAGNRLPVALRGRFFLAQRSEREERPELFRQNARDQAGLAHAQGDRRPLAVLEDLGVEVPQRAKVINDLTSKMMKAKAGQLAEMARAEVDRETAEVLRGVAVVEGGAAPAPQTSSNPRETK